MTASTDYLTNTKARLVLMQKAAITTPDGSAPEAYRYMSAMQNTFPYWVNVTGPVDIAQSSTRGYETRDHTIIMRLVIGHLTSDYRGQHEERLDEWIPEVLTYFSDRPSLRRTTADTVLTYLRGAAAIDSVTGLSFVTIGDTTQIKCDFALTAPFLVSVTQVF